MARAFARNKYLNQARDDQVLYLPSYFIPGWRRNKNDIPNRIPISNLPYFKALYKLKRTSFVVCCV